MDPDDRASLLDLVEVVNAVRRRDAPWMHDLTEAEAEGELRHGWEGDPATRYLLRADGVAVGTAAYDTSAYDNHHVAWLEIEVHPEHRRRGFGTALLEAMAARARSEGRTSLAVVGWDSPSAPAFATARGYEQKAVEVIRRQHLQRLDVDALARARDEALPHAGDYTFTRLLGPVPEADLEAVARMAAAINDAPTDGLEVEDDLYPPARIRAYERAQAAQGTLHRVLARHRGSGAFAGQTVIAVAADRPWLAEQHDTSVVREHRGHRLGLLLKIEMLAWLRESQPQLEVVDTWNAASNEHMIGVNEALGFEVVGGALIFQGSL